MSLSLKGYTALCRMDKARIDYVKSVRSWNASLVSLILPPNDSLERVRAMVSRDLQQATTEGCVTALSEALKILQLRTSIPMRGLIIYTGNVLESTTSLSFEPPVHLQNSLYLIDKKFHTFSTFE
jgi:peptide subunit release factor 1 (eRF1)